MLTTLLPQLGLSLEETQIYESLLQNGPQTVAQLTSSTPIKRTYIYALCEQLIQRKLVAKTEQAKKATYHLLSPSALLLKAEDNKNAAESTFIQLEALLPTLTSQYILKETKPAVRMFEGLDGIKKVYLDTIAVRQPIYALVETSSIDPDVYNWVTQDYAQRRVEAHISVKAIVASGVNTSRYTQLNQSELRETKQVDSALFPFKNEINIYGDKLSVINHQKDGPLLGIIIEKSNIAQTFRSWFHLTWSLLANK